MSLERRCHGVKSLIGRREEIKQRLRAQTSLHRASVRATELRGLRQENLDDASSTQRWREALGWDVDISQPEIQSYLLQLEEEIRQEQFFEQFDSSFPDSNEWEEYYASLSS